MIANHFTSPEIVLFLSPSRRSKDQRSKEEKWGEKRNEESRIARGGKSAPTEELGGQTCIPAAVQQLQLTSIRPPLALLPDRFLLSRHATSTNYGRLTPNRLDCDLFFSVNVCVCASSVGGGRCSGSILITRSASLMPTGCLYLLCVWFKVAHFSWPSILTPHICLLPLYISQVSFSL